jgi:hypothetical protein
VLNRKQNSRSKQVPPRLLRPHNQPDGSKEPLNSAVPGLLFVPASHKIDPFNVLPVDERGNSQYLISKRKLPAELSLSSFVIDNNLNNQVVYTVWYPASLKTSSGLQQFLQTVKHWSDRPYSPIKPAFGEVENTKAIMSDSAMLHILLSHVAKGLRSLLNIDLGSDANYHYSKAIAIVNKRIANFHYEAIGIKNLTILVVSLLIHWEVRISPLFAFLIIIANAITLLD